MSASRYSVSPGTQQWIMAHLLPHGKPGLCLSFLVWTDLPLIILSFGLPLVFSVSLHRMNISQRRPCLRRTWKTLSVCTMHWRPRPQTMRRSPMCLSLKPPTGGSCFFKPSTLRWSMCVLVCVCGGGRFPFAALRIRLSTRDSFWIRVKSQAG